MSDRDAFERIMTSLYDAVLDDTQWPLTSTLIDEACGLTGNTLLVGEGPMDDIQAHFVGVYYRGQRRTDLEREYTEVYYPIDEMVPRLRQQSNGRLVQISNLYTTEELKTSRTYNEILLRAKYQNGLAVRMAADGAYKSWGRWILADPMGSADRSSTQIKMIARLVPHIRQFFRLRQALVRAQARAVTAATLLDNPRLGVVHLDRRGRIMAVNDHARGILRHGDALSDRDGELHARTPDDQRRLERLLAAALPTSDAVGLSGSMPLRRSSVLVPLVVHVKPVAVQQPHYGARFVAALVLIDEPERPHRIDPRLIAATLGLTPGESQVAAWLAEGRSVDEMAQATGHTRGAIYWHLKQIYQKLHISRQPDLVRLVLSVAELGC